MPLKSHIFPVFYYQINHDRRLTFWPISPAPHQYIFGCFLAVDQVNSQLNKHNPQNRPQATDRLKTDEKPDDI